MDRKTLLLGAGLIALAVWLYGRSRASANVYAKPEVIEGLPVFSFIIPPITIEPGGSISYGDDFDWMGGDNCGCGVTGSTPLIVDSVSTYRSAPGYSFIGAPNLAIPDALKGGVGDLGTVYTPVRKTWHYDYGWDSKRRMRKFVVTSDGGTFITGKHYRMNDGHGRYDKQSKSGGITGKYLTVTAWDNMPNAVGGIYEYDASQDRAKPRDFYEGFESHPKRIAGGWGTPDMFWATGGG